MAATLCRGQNVAIGSAHFHVVCSDGSVQGWGANTEGELGNGTFLNSQSPVSASALSNVTSVAAGSTSFIALKSDSTVWTCGGDLGNGSANNSNIAVKVPYISGIVAIAAAPDRSFAVKNDGTVWGWGSNSVGALGDGTTTYRDYPTQASITDVRSIAAGNFFTVALKKDGTVWAWGYNAYGCLGNGTLNDSYVPVQVTGLNNIVAISACSHSFALKDDGTVWAWGDNYYGQLGDGTVNSTGCNCKNVPTQISISNVRSIAAGGGHSIAVKNDGTVWGWGYNQWGQLGDGTNTNRTAPVQISSLQNVASISAYAWSTMALKQDGSVWTWGDYGKPLGGDSTMTADTTNHPTQVYGLCQMSADMNTIPATERQARVFPNPADGEVNVEGEVSLIKMYDSQGKEILVTSSKRIEIGQLSAGFYWMELESQNGVAREKLIVSH